MIACLPNGTSREKAIMWSNRAFAASRSSGPGAENTMKSGSMNRSTNRGLSDSTTGRISSRSVLVPVPDSIASW
jgi:hypothetical protein